MKKIINISLGIFLLLTVKIQAQTSQQNALIEVFTGTWAGYAPDGFVVLETTLANNPNAFAINIHNGDDMSFADGDYITSFYGVAFPQAVINRDGPPIPRNTWQSYTNTVLQGTSIVSVSFDSVRYDSPSGLLDVYIKASFTGSASGDMRFNCVLVEDSVTGTGSGYDQYNYYNTTVSHTYYQAGDPILGLHHRYVARSFLGGAWGVSGIIPASVSNGTTASYHFSMTVPSSYDDEQLSLIGIVSKYDGTSSSDREILNVEKYDSIAPLILSINESQVSDFHVYPNPSTGEITIEGTEEGILEITNLNGQKVLTYSLNEGANKFNLPLSSGMYYLSVITSKSISTTKLVIE